MILAILQARVSSTRLPGKVLKPLLGEPMLKRQLERLKRSQRITQLVVATSDDAGDDPIEELCRSIGAACSRGSLNDVLDRFYQAAKPYSPEQIVRLTGDCPLADPQLIDSVIDYHFSGGFDYTSNCLEPSFPDGLDVEVFRSSALETAWSEAKLPSEREHVTPFINQHPERFQLGLYRGESDLSHLRWTVDELRDFELVEKIYGELYPDNHEFATADILQLIRKHPELAGYNTQYERNEGYKNSLQEDAKVMAVKQN